MVDIHCHILHRFDDGSSGLEESLAMARMAAESGVTDIVATPHFPGQAATLGKMGRMMDRFQELSAAIRREGIPLTLHPGAEILCMAGTIDLAIRGQLPTLGDTPYFLTEFHFDESYAFMDEMLEALADAGYIPVVAHPERYDTIGRQPLILERWFRRGYVLQMNKGSPLGAFGSRVQRTARIILDAGLAHVIASDAHSAVHRTTNMAPLTAWLEENLDAGYARILTEDNPRRLIRGQSMVPAE